MAKVCLKFGQSSEIFPNLVTLFTGPKRTHQKAGNNWTWVEDFLNKFDNKINSSVVGHRIIVTSWVWIQMDRKRPWFCNYLRPNLISQTKLEPIENFLANFNAACRLIKSPFSLLNIFCQICKLTTTELHWVSEITASKDPLCTCSNIYTYSTKPAFPTCKTSAYILVKQTTSLCVP